MVIDSHLISNASSLPYTKIIKKWLSNQETFVSKLQKLDQTMQQPSPDKYPDDSYKESLLRINRFKIHVEDKSGFSLLKEDQSEKRLQEMLHLFFNNTSYSVDREVNNGRGSLDFKVSKGANDCTIIETKLASNTKLRQNLANQVKVYCKANDTSKHITIIGYFSKKEKLKVDKVLRELGLDEKENYILINCEYNLPSASNVK